MSNDKCLFCKSKKCSYRVVRYEVPRYDEVACSKHVDDLYKHVDATLGVENGIGRHYMSSTGHLSRGKQINGLEDAK